MDIVITYCAAWNYLPRAASLAAAIKQGLGVEPKLVKGHNGVFDVAVDGQLLFSKNRDGRFPTDTEVVARLQAVK